MKGEYQIADLRGRLMAAKDRLTIERLNIFSAYALADNFSRETYGFAYIRAERLGLRAIHRRMAEISWLPTKLDTSNDLTADTRDRLAQWVKKGEKIKPDAAIFGNEFLHALTRCLLKHDADSEEFHAMSDRIALLFRDMSYLIASIHCCNVFKGMGMDHVRLSAPDDLGKTAFDLTITLETLVMMHGGDNGEVNENKPVSTGAPYLRLVPTAGIEHPLS